MAIRVIVDHPGRGLRGLGRGVVVVLGILLVTAGLVAAILPLLFLLLVVTSLASGDDLSLSDDDIPALLAATGIAIVALVVGLRLIRGRRRMALFLRRFGYDEATAAVTAAVSAALGRSWRVVTLDDREVAPVGPTKSGRRLSRMGFVVGIAVIAAALWWWFGGGLDRFVDDFAESASADTEDVAAAILAPVFAIIVAFIIALFLVVIPAAFFGGLTLLSVASHRAGLRGERAKQTEVSAVRDIRRVANAITRSTRRTLGPRLVVVRVASPIWQRAVYELAGRASIVIVDVSQPTNNLVWEIETLRPSSRPRWIFIAHRPRLEALTGQHQAAGSPALQVLAAIDGSYVIAYDTDRASTRRFARALYGALAGRVG